MPTPHKPLPLAAAVRSAFVLVRVTPAEREVLRRAAERVGQPVSAFVREQALRRAKAA